MESGRLYFDSSACRGNNMNMLFLGNADLGFRGIFLNLMSFYGTILFFWIVNCWCCCLVWFVFLKMVFVWMVGHLKLTHNWEVQVRTQVKVFSITILILWVELRLMDRWWDIFFFWLRKDMIWFDLIWFGFLVKEATWFCIKFGQTKKKKIWFDLSFC